jgi:hypothetical protein
MSVPRRPRPPPASIERELDLAGRALAAGRLEEARRACERIAAADPRARYLLALIDLRQGRFKAASLRLQEVARRQPRDYGAWHNLGVAFQELGLWRRAAGAYGRARALRPEAEETGFALAGALAAAGEGDAAIALWRQLARTAPERALTRLALLRPAAVTDDELERLRRAAAANPNAPAFAYALGGVLDARHDDEAAFAALAAGARARLAQLEAGDPACRPDAIEAAHERSARVVKASVTAAFVARHQRLEETAAPIFIVGMPRCGSTLVEQILASHPAVQGLGETAALPTLVEGGFPYFPARATADPVADLAARYLDALRERGWRPPLRPVDKTLENYLHVGVIRTLFPRALILHCLRDPVENCLACYRQMFATGGELFLDLPRIGRAYVRYRGLMDHWEAVLPGVVIPVRYEALVADPRTAIRHLVVETCGLAWSARCARFHETRRAVTTASADQVRRPMLAAPQERRRGYARRLGPLLEALGSYAASTTPA